MSTRISMHDDLLRGAFQRFDVDNSGFLTKKKFLGTNDLSSDPLTLVLFVVYRR